jgi:hypothetical protein
MLLIEEKDDTQRTFKEEQLIARALIKAKIVDRSARIIFPLLFVLFNFGYWGYYLHIFG